MDFSLTDDQQQLQDAVIEFARRELAHDMIEADRAQAFSRAAWERCAAFGVLGLPIPEQYGGGGSDLLTTMAVMEGLGYGSRDQGLIFSMNAHLWTNSIPILLYGTEAQKQRYLPGLCNGALIGANGASEPEAGSDVFSMRTRAERDGDDYVLNGTKMFVTNAQVADVIVAYATVNPAWGPMGITAFIIEMDRPGVSVSRKIEKMGLRTSPMAEVIFDNCRVPVEQRLGREGRGADVFNCSMEWERGSILAACLGTMRRQLEECVAYARQRRQFGQAIGRFQSVANRIVDMKVRLETSRALVYRIGWLKGLGRNAEVDAAMAKLHTSDAFIRNCMDAIQVHGGYGYMTEFPFEREMRDAMGSTLYSGTSEIQRTIIAKGLGL
ncbi:MAG: acyl-CoA dehydrogenase family protein [Phycisphaeraceae bacterium]|nr:acyl-CoA dehydrogenase family protein [Phycisphaeraceae bacterium]